MRPHRHHRHLLRNRDSFMVSNQINELVPLLAEYELTIAALYETFASVLPESKEAWTAFADEERLHAKWINTLYIYLKQGKISPEQTKFTVRSVKTALAFIKNQIEKTKNEKPDLIQALNTDINIESSLLESAFFTVFHLNVPEAQKIRDRLKKETESHKERFIQWREGLRS